MDIDTEEIEETAFYISSHLNETEKGPGAQIRKIVTVLGPEQALAFLKQAREIEKSGGMLAANGKRRTIGGVFFSLVKSQCDEATVNRIWPARPWPGTKKKPVQAATTEG